MNILALPNDVQNLIMSLRYLKMKSLAAIRIVCKDFRTVVDRQPQNVWIFQIFQEMHTPYYASWWARVLERTSMTEADVAHNFSVMKHLGEPLENSISNHMVRGKIGSDCFYRIYSSLDGELYVVAHHMFWKNAVLIYDDDDGEVIFRSPYPTEPESDWKPFRTPTVERIWNAIDKWT